MSTCTNKTSECANCGGSHRSYYKGCPRFKAYVDAGKADIEIKRNQSSEKTILSSPSYQTGTIATTKYAVQPTHLIYNEEDLQNQIAQQIQSMLSITIPKTIINPTANDGNQVQSGLNKRQRILAKDNKTSGRNSRRSNNVSNNRHITSDSDAAMDVIE
ncbi:hypothetical protein ACOME3_002997 [Neoechinorhynchus agilis]